MDLSAVEALRFIASHLAKGSLDEVPDGWKTSKQWSADGQKSTAQTGVLLENGVKAGVVEKQMFRIMMDGGSTRKVAHYRVKM